MRIGLGRLAQKSCPNRRKDLPPHFYAFSATKLHYRGTLSRHELDQRCLVLLPRSHASTTTATRLDAAARRSQQGDEAIKTARHADDDVPGTKESVGQLRVRENLKGLKNVAEKEEKKKKKWRRGKEKHYQPDPSTYTSLLDKVVPQNLRAGAHAHSAYSSAASPFEGDTHAFIVDTIRDATNAGIDLLTYLGITQGRWKAVLWLADTLLQNVSSRMLDPRRIATASNIVWGSQGLTLNDLTEQPFSVGTLAHTGTRSLEECTAFPIDPRYSDLASEHKDRTMSIIWSTLGNLIIEGAELPEQESEVVMAAVYQIIAKVHALGLVPDAVYSYTRPHHNSMVQRPPILHLLSSRILTTLSDATWRSHQMDIIEQAVSTGVPLQSLVKDLPGGRFRLKVRPLGPEVWLEFVLWCCVEGGFGTSGTRIISSLQQQTWEPWFAVPWTSQGGSAMSSTVDWDRVRSRHGGSVGLLEGYNREPPFVEMAPRTVSAEVVLSLIETVANSMSIGSSDRWLSRKMANSRWRAQNRIKSRWLGTNVAISKAVPSLMEFLEPHSLPEEYIDYLAVRFLQTGAFDVEKYPQWLERWVEQVSHFRSLETTYTAAPATATFDLHSICEQSEVYAGMLHQAMEAYVDKFDVRNAVAVFNRIQELVDVSKLRSISAFLAATPIQSDRSFDSQEFFTSHTSINSVDFLRSHGQLPLHKLSAFLNLTTDSKLLRIAEWLLYSDDVDEPVIPRRLYDAAGLTVALVRFASVSGDEELLFRLITARKNATMMPSVSLLRSLVDAFLLLHNFREAHRTLNRVRKAKGGGYGVNNLANLAAAIFTLQSRAKDSNSAEVKEKLRQALQLISGMMAGYYDSRSGTYRNNVLAAFRQQIAALLVVLSSIRGSSLSPLAREWQVPNSLNNGTILSTQTFNIVLASIVDTQGSSEGVRLWQLFCASTESQMTNIQDIAFDEYPVEDHFFADDENYDPSSQAVPASDSVTTSGEYVPFVKADNDTPLELNEEDGADAHYMTEASFVSFANSFPVVEDEVEVEVFEDPEPRSLVKADLRTLRIIVRGAIGERRALRRQGADSVLQRKVLDWATFMYRLLGATKKDIEQEIQQAIDENAVSVQQQNLRKANKYRLAAYLRQRRKKESVYEPFRRPKLFLGLSNPAAAEQKAVIV